MQTEKNSKLHYFFSQPHQPFFTTGILSAILFMLLFLLSYKGSITLTTSPNFFHAYSLIFIVFTSFFQGFLLTTFPRFSQVGALEQKIYTTNFTLLFSGSLLFLTGTLVHVGVLYVGMLLLLANQLYTLFLFRQIYKASFLPDKHDQFWIMLSFGMGALANILFLLNRLDPNPILESLAKGIAIYLYIVFVALSVGQRMIPFFSHVMIERKKGLLQKIFILFVGGIVGNLTPYPIGSLLFFTAALLLAKEIHRWRLPFAKAEPILWILHLAIFWLPLALFIGSIAEFVGYFLYTNFLFLATHLIVLGFVTTVLIGFGTRVTLGHSGNMMVTDNQTKILFYLTQIILYARVLYSFTATAFIFDITIGLWLLLFSWWSFKYMPALAFGKRIT